MNKHINTNKDKVKPPKEKKKKVAVSRCSLCEEKFKCINDLKEHITEHLDDIKEIDIDHLKSDHEIYEGTLCLFESGHCDRIREHTIAHILESKPTEK